MFVDITSLRALSFGEENSTLMNRNLILTLKLKAKIIFALTLTGISIKVFINIGIIAKPRV